jgi:hypothetical protein
MLADAIRRIGANRSVSELYEEQENELARQYERGGPPLFDSAFGAEEAPPPVATPA